MRTVDEIRKADAAWPSEFSQICTEPGEDVAEDRRQLLRLLDEAVVLIDEARGQPDDLHGAIDDKIAAFKAKIQYCSCLDDEDAGGNRFKDWDEDCPVHGRAARNT